MNCYTTRFFWYTEAFWISPCLRNEKSNILLWQGWLLVGLLTYQTLRKAPGLYATSLIPFSRPNHPHKVSFLLFLKTIWCLFSFFVNSGDGLIFERTSSFSSYFAFCRPHQSLVPTLTQNWTLSWSFLNQILIRLILIQMTPVSAAALWGVACSSSIPSGSLWYRQDQWRWRNWWRTLCSLDDPWGRSTRRNLAC